MRKSQSVRYSDPSLPDAPSLYKSSAARQKTVKNLFKDSHHFKNMIVGAQQAGMGIEQPSPYEIKHKYLDMEYKDMEAYVNIQREKWKTYGCTIMSDGWTGPTKLSIINFMDVIKEVGKQNVVQIVTDNGSAFVKAGKLLMKKYNLYWTPCGSTLHRLKMRKVCGGDIVRPGATRFATNYIALDSLLKKKANLKKVFISDEWAQHNLSRTLIGKEVESLMFDHCVLGKSGKIVGIETLKHPLHAAVGTDPDLLQAVHKVFAKLDPTSEGLVQFGNEIILFRDAKEDSVIEQRLLRAEWWFMYGHHAPTLRRLAIKNMTKLQRKDYLDLLDIAIEVGEEEITLFQWVRPLHLDDEDGNPDPRIAAHVREAGVDVDRVLSEEIHTDSFSQDMRDSFQQGISQPPVTSRPSFDSTSVEHSSRPSATGTSASDYDGSRGEGTNDGSDPGNDEGMLDNNNKVDNHWHLLVKMISHIVLKMKTTALEEPVRCWKPLESHIEEDNEG
ncbi:hypothetical protein CK203_031883 [Vitis vinifera]|uniref:DUF659 domain-containing protein n=1 Tax=Vitis vinifera TaxID=29760 RepID=A0A438IND2_VITVI|nr:hypothetical protein CK203_031883 [Vitis vinifera]